MSSKKCSLHKGEKVQFFCRKANCDAKNRICCPVCIAEGPHKKHITVNLSDIQERFDSSKTAWKKIEKNAESEFKELERSLTQQVFKMASTLTAITNLMATLDNIKKNYKNYINNLDKKYKGQLEKIHYMTKLLSESTTKIQDISDRNTQDQMNDFISTLPTIDKNQKLTTSLHNFFSIEIDEYNHTSKNDEDFILDITERTKQHLQKFLLDFDLGSFKSEQHNILEGHKYMILAIEKIDENVIATAGVDQSIRLWNIEKNEIQQHIEKAHEDSIRAIVKMNNNFLITGSTDNSIKLWNIKKVDQNHYELQQKEELQNAHEDWIQSISRIDNEKFASGGFDRSVKIWKIDEETEKIVFLNVFTLTGKVSENSISTLGNNHMIVCDQDKQTTIIDLNKNEVIKQIQSETNDSENCLMIYDDVDVFCSASNKSISFWRISDGRLIKRHDKVHAGQINKLEKLADNLILSVACDMSAKIWKVSEDYEIEEMRQMMEIDKIFACRRIQKNCLVTAGWNEKIIIWR